MTPYELVLHSITVITIFFQVYVFYLVQMKSPKNMKNYRFFLNYFTFWDLIFTLLMGAFLQPDPVGLMTSFRVYGISSWISPNAQRVVAGAVFATGINVFLSQDYCLIYRYTAILENNRFHEGFVTTRMKFLLFLGGQLLSGGVFFVAYGLMLSPEQFFDPNYETEKLAELRVHIQPDEFLLLPIISSRMSRYFMIFVLAFFLASEVFSILIIYAILSSLRKKTGTFSKNTYKLHYQLTLLLAVQLAIPFFLIVLPISIRWLNFLVTGTMSSFADHFRMALVTLYGFANSLFTVFFVTPYRAHFYNNLIYPWLYPITKLLKINGWQPRRKSITWISSTKREMRVMTLAKSSVFGSD